MTAVAKPLEHLDFDVGARSKQKVTAHLPTGRQGPIPKGRTAMPPVGQQQGALGQTRQQVPGQLPFRLARLADGGG